MGRGGCRACCRYSVTKVEDWILCVLNSACVYWMSKKQTSVDLSSFGSELVAMKQCCEYMQGLRYKLWMMGIPCEGPAYIHGDNQSVLASCGIADSVLKKKSQSIAYHFVWEGAARDKWRTLYVNTNDNKADLLTKLLPSGEKRKCFVSKLLHHIFQSRWLGESVGWWTGGSDGALDGLRWTAQAFGFYFLWQWVDTISTTETGGCSYWVNLPEETHGRR